MKVPWNAIKFPLSTKTPWKSHETAIKFPLSTKTPWKSLYETPLNSHQALKHNEIPMKHN